MRSLFLVFLVLLSLPIAASAAPPPIAASVEAVQAADVRPPVVTPQMLRYSRTRVVLYFVGTAYGLLALWGVHATGLSARFARLVQPQRFSFLRLVGYYALLETTLLLVRSPLIFYSGYSLEHIYGLSSQSLGAWLGDVCEGSTEFSPSITS